MAPSRSLTRRKRVDRDEVTGDPLPAEGTEDVVFLKLHYPLLTQPNRASSYSSPR